MRAIKRRALPGPEAHHPTKQPWGGKPGRPQADPRAALEARGVQRLGHGFRGFEGTAAGRSVLGEENDNRKSDRLMCSELVEIAFQDQTGRWVRETGVIENVGSNGLGVSFSIPVTVGRSVTVSNSRFRSEAVIKHCAFEEYGYLLGLEFSGGFEWNHADWEPQHLLRLPRE